MLSPSSAVAVTNDVMAQSPSKMDDMKNTYNSEVQDFFDETVEQAMEQDGEFINSYYTVEGRCFLNAGDANCNSILALLRV